MASFNKVTIVGYLGRDVESRFMPDGKCVANFSVATSERKKDRNGEAQDVTTWFRVSVFGKSAEACQQYLKKGSLVYVDGRLSLNEYTDRDGNQRASLEVRGNDVQFLGRKEDEQRQSSRPKDELDGALQYAQRQQAQRASRTFVALETDDESEVPF